MKKRILTIALVVALLATCFAGTYAYLKDDEAQVNTFTTGKVYITLDEAKVAQNAAGNYEKVGDERVTASKDSLTGNAYHLLPNTTVVKDPTITLDEGSEKAYIAAKVTVSGNSENGNLYDLLGIANTDLIDINGVVKGGLVGGTPTAETWKGMAGHSVNGCFVYQIPNKANNTWTLYIFIQDAKEAESQIVLFEQLKINKAWDNAEMQILAGMSIKVQAYATQAAGFGDCHEAITTAFPGFM